MNSDLAPPPLAEPYATTLRQAVAWAKEAFAPVGILATGSIVRGNPGPSSDLDLCVLHRAHWRQRVQRFFNGVPAELFVNPPEQIRRYFVENAASGRPIDLHMFATGVAVHDPTGVVRGLQEEARAMLAAGPALAPHILPQACYFAATLLEDACDIADGDPATASLFLHRAVEDTLLYRYLRDNRWLPRPKERLSTLDTFDPAPDLPARLALAHAIVERVIGRTGSFEWSSVVEELRF